MKKEKTVSLRQITFRRKMVPYIFITPNLIIFLTFSIIPIFMGVWYSFTRFDGVRDPKFIGFDNYIKLASDVYFKTAMKETLVLVCILVPLVFFVSLMLANLLKENLKFKGLYRVSFYWPVMISAIVIGIIWQWMFGDTVGLLNNIRRMMGLDPIKTLTDPTFAKAVVVFAVLWSRAGYYMVIFLGGLQSIPSSLYEAATIDGTTKLQRFTKVTFPLLKPTSLMVFILMSMDFFKIYALVKSLTNGGPYRATTYIVQHIYEVAFDKAQFGYASSMSVIMMIVVLIFTACSFKLSKGGEI